MTCFWKGLLSCLDEQDFALLQTRKPRTEADFAYLLQHCNRAAKSVQWQNTVCPQQFRHECVEAVRNLKVSQIGGGYWCSTCDPFLLLVSELFQINIHHQYCGHLILYTNTKTARKTIYVKSNNSHFEKSKPATVHIPTDV